MKVAAILRAHQLAKQQKVRRNHTQLEKVCPLAIQAREDGQAFMAILDQEQQNFHPDPMGRHQEPKSIYSPAGQSRLQFVGPKKRRTAERTDRDCELPADKRRYRVLTMVDSHDRPAMKVHANPFTKSGTIKFV